MQKLSVVAWMLTLLSFGLSARASERDSLRRELLTAQDTVRGSSCSIAWEKPTYLPIPNRQKNTWTRPYPKPSSYSLRGEPPKRILHRATIACREGEALIGEQEAAKALTLYQATRDEYGTGKSHRVLGNAYYYQGKYPEAKRQYERALARAPPGGCPA